MDNLRSLEVKYLYADLIRKVIQNEQVVDAVFVDAVIAGNVSIDIVYLLTWLQKTKYGSYCAPLMKPY